MTAITAVPLIDPPEWLGEGDRVSNIVPQSVHATRKAVDHGNVDSELWLYTVPGFA